MIGLTIRVWNSIQEPRVLRIIFMLAYVVTAAMGLVTLWQPPSSVTGVLGDPQTIGLAIFLTLGGVIAALAILPGWWGLERLGIVSSYIGLAIYAFVVIQLQATAAPSSSRLTQLGVIVLASFVYTIRLVLIRGHEFAPRG